MSTAIQINTHDIEFTGERQQAVNARELHKLLEVGKDFSNWMRERRSQLNMVEGIDFVIVENLSSPESASSKNDKKNTENTARQNRGAVNRDTSGLIAGANRIDYFVSMDMAKHLSMLQKNAQGHRARMYFIECEKQLRKREIEHAARTVFLLDQPTEWERLFPIEFFSELSRVYRRTFTGMKGTPSFFGTFINSHVYAPLWDELSDELKEKRRAFNGSDEKTMLKLHQFLEQNARSQVERQIQRIIGLLEVCEDINEFKSRIAKRNELKNQMLLQLRYN